ncbi:hypothetical protein V5F53_12900 [Xanthobacter sp. V4C-4]|uniref:hypothetical protein n=1 Tax=Xanthobacter cornucopiae TaxID=3119924 RepID=UPI00372BF4A9
MDRPELTFPPDESRHVREAYGAATVILEYGTGGSTVLCSELPGKTLFAVESDGAWLDGVRGYIEGQGTGSTIVYHHADVGPTKRWGYPKDPSKAREWSAYSVGVWKRPEFRQPELVLIDGRFRVACFLATVALTQAPVTILFDDYTPREHYHVVEELAKPVEYHGRMAVFKVQPGLLTVSRLLDYIGYFHDTR